MAYHLVLLLIVPAPRSRHPASVTAQSPLSALPNPGDLMHAPGQRGAQPTAAAAGPRASAPRVTVPIVPPPNTSSPRQNTMAWPGAAIGPSPVKTTVATLLPDGPGRTSAAAGAPR